MKKHWLDKPILRHIFWAIVMPYNLKMFLAEQKNKPDRRYCQGCEAYYPAQEQHKDGNRVCQLDANGQCLWVRK